MSLRLRSVRKATRTIATMAGDGAIAAAVVSLVVVARRTLDIPLTRALLPTRKFPLTLHYLALWVFALVVAMALSGFYDTTASPRHRPTLFVALPLQLAIVAVIGTLFEVPWPRSVFLAVPLLESLAIAAWRSLFSHLWPLRAARAVVIGTSEDLLALSRDLEREPHTPLEIDGLVSAAGELDDPRFIGTIDDPAARAAIASAAEVIDLGADDGVRRLLLLSLRGAQGFLFVPHIRDGIVAGSSFAMVGDRPLAEVRMHGAYGAGAAVKRAFDIVAAAFLLLLTLPLQLIAAVAVASERRGRIFHMQQRLGLDGRLFSMWKFRTMEHQEEDDGTRAVDNDRRITPVGRWLRRYRLDELPQLFNVLHGDMSLVGPRPELPDLARAINERLPFFDLRLAMRPGIAGLAQVSAEYDQSAETKLTYDLQYLCSWSPLLDIRILVQTITIVLAGRGV